MMSRELGRDLSRDLSRDLRLGLVALALLGVGCGGSSSGGGGGGTSSSGSGATGASGGVVAAPVSGSLVRIYTIDAVTRGLTELTTATTQSDGSFSVDFNGAGPFLIVANAGDFEDEATGVTRSLASASLSSLDANAGRTLSAIVGTGASGRLTLWLTPLSTFATRRVIELSRTTAGALSELEVARVCREVAQEFGLGSAVDVRTVAPFDFTDAAQASPISASAGDPRSRAGLVLAALSQRANDLSLTDPLALVEALAEDYRDGGFNGLAGTGAISLGSRSLSAADATVELSQSARRFLQNPRNQSGTTTNTFTSLLDALESIEVLPLGVNRPPTLASLADLTLSAGSGSQQVTLSDVSPGLGEVQTFTVSVVFQPAGVLANPVLTGNGTTRTLSFDVQAAGVTTVLVTLQDDGGTANGGVDTFQRSFKVTVGSGGSSGSTSTQIPGLLIPQAGTVPNEWFLNNDPSSRQLHSHTSAEQTFADEVFRLVNQDRAAQGLSALTYDPLLEAAAKVHAEDMSRRNYFSHETRDFPINGATVTGFGAFSRMDRVGATSGNRENIAAGQSSPSAVMNSWLNSTGHRNNIRASSARKIGVGYSANGRYWVQVFSN